MIAMNNASILAQLLAYRGAVLLSVAPAPCKVHLIKANFAPSAESKIADFTEADYTGYLAQAADLWQAPNYIGSGRYEVLGTTVLQFAMTGPAVANTIYGYYLLDNNGVLISVCKFNVAVPLTFTPLVNLSILPSIEWDAVLPKNDLSPVP